MTPKPAPKPFVVTIPGGLNLPVPHWTLPIFGMLVVTAMTFAVYRYFYPVQPELVSAQQANRALRLEVDEYNNHIMETPQITLGDIETLRVTAYEDGCMVVARKFAGKISTRLLVSPVKSNASHLPAPVLLADLWLELLPTLKAEQTYRCLNPHPNPFVWRYGERAYGERCWIPVIRTFQDGCEHYQMFNTCTNTWDTLRDGSPNIRWTRCVHTESK